jgi:transcriptional regulator with XRE-family HTH domain
VSQLRQQFAKRLKQAMQAAGLKPIPSVLVDQFNLEYRGKSVTFQTASRWLRGEALPDVEKVQTLARLLGIGACQLLFGERARLSVREPADEVAEPLRALDRKMLLGYFRLESEQRKLVRDLVDGLGGAVKPEG